VTDVSTEVDNVYFCHPEVQRIEDCSNLCISVVCLKTCLTVCHTSNRHLTQRKVQIADLRDNFGSRRKLKLRSDGDDRTSEMS
jgi:hypothetical protein